MALRILRISMRGEKSRPGKTGRDVLLEIREAAGITRAALARAAGLDPSQVFKTETARGTSNFVLVAKLARALNVNLDALAATVLDKKPVPTTVAADALLSETLIRVERGLSIIKTAVDDARTGTAPRSRAGRRPTK